MIENFLHSGRKHDTERKRLQILLILTVFFFILTIRNGAVNFFSKPEELKNLVKTTDLA